jgi:hypothetical protein
MRTQFEFKEVQNVVVSLDDGSTWKCAVDPDNGTLIPLYELNKPTNPAPPPPQPQQQQQQQPQPQQPGQAQGQGQGGYEELEEQDVEDAPAAPGQAHQGVGLNTNDVRKLVDEVVKSAGKNKVPDRLKMADHVFRSRLQSVMTDNMYDRKTRGKKRGSLDMKHLYKAEVGSNNLFMQKTARKGKQYNIVLCVDSSGSMGGPGSGEPLGVAGETVVFLANAFSGLNLNFAVVGFSDNVKVHKDFNEKYDPHENAQDLFNKITHFGNSGTNDLGGMRESYKLLQNKSGQKNFVILISDGESGRNTEIRAIEEANKDLAQAFGVGIFSTCGQVRENKTIRDINQLKPTILNYLKSHIKRG